MAAPALLPARHNRPQNRTNAVKSRGDPEAPGTVAVAFWVPTRLPSVQVTLVLPSAA